MTPHDGSTAPIPPIYAERADLYDLLYSFKDYEQEAEALHELLDDIGVADGERVLEAACGTGNYLVHLARWYDVSGFDLSPHMLIHARQKLPTADLFVADLRTFTVDAPVDAILCLFSSIAYLHTLDELHAAIKRFADALSMGGALIIEPWLTRGSVEDGHLSQTTYSGQDIKICRQGVTTLHDNVTVTDLHWMVTTRDRGTTFFPDRHALRCTSVEEMTAALDRAGFDVDYEDEGPLSGRGLYVAHKRVK